MNPEVKAALDATAAERAVEQPPDPKSLVLNLAEAYESLHARLTAVENHPALSIPALHQEQPNG